MQERNGAETLVETLLAGQVDVCFANPGTSEMQFVAALDKIPGMRCVLGRHGCRSAVDRPRVQTLHPEPGAAAARVAVVHSGGSAPQEPRHHVH